jgi:hypothetical protein
MEATISTTDETAIKIVGQTEDLKLHDRMHAAVRERLDPFTT